MFNINYIQLFKSVSPEVATIFTAMLPVAELRVSIPIALGVYKLSVFSSFFWSVLGNIIPGVIILKYIGPISNWLIKRSQTMKRFFEWLFKRTRDRFSGKYLKYGELALILFVAIPLPVTGCWTGSVAAFLFGIHPKRAIWLILAGICIAGIIVTVVSLLGVRLFLI